MNNSSKIFDGVLVHEYRTGSKKALGVLVKKYHVKFCRHACFYTKDIDAAKDVVQDSWGIILNKLHTLKDPNLFGSWAFQIVTRKGLDFANQNKHKSRRFDQREIVQEVVESTSTGNLHLQDLKRAILKLPENHQIVLRLFYTEGYSLNEISSILELSVGTVKSRLFHAREKLKITLKT